MEGRVMAKTFGVALPFLSYNKNGNGKIMDALEIFGVCAFVLVLGVESKIKALGKLERRVRKLEKRDGYRKNGEMEEIAMSKLIDGLVGKHCCLIREEEDDLEGRILDVDEEWIQIAVDKKGKEECQLVRIESVSEVTGIAD